MRIFTPLAAILTAIVLVAADATPVLAESVLFSDDFDKPFINDGWQIGNDSPDMRALDSGRLAVVTETGFLSKGSAKNVLTLKAPLSEKNADVTATLRVDIQEYGDTWNKRVLGGIVLYGSKKDYLLLYIVNFRAGYTSSSGPYAILVKRQGNRTRPLLQRQLSKMKKGPMEFWIRIEKRNYKYSGYASLDGKKWRKIGTFGVLNASFHPGLFAVRGKEAAEAIFEFDRFSVVKKD